MSNPLNTFAVVLLAFPFYLAQKGRLGAYVTLAKPGANTPSAAVAAAPAATASTTSPANPVTPNSSSTASATAVSGSSNAGDAASSSSSSNDDMELISDAAALFA